MKGVEFHPVALKIIKKFPNSVKGELGKAINDLQKGDIYQCLFHVL